MNSFEKCSGSFLALFVCIGCSGGAGFTDPPGSDPGFTSPSANAEEWEKHPWKESTGDGAPAPAVPVQLAAGGHHTCARMEDGTVRCWGDDSSGQLGGSSLATPVEGIEGAVDIVAGDYHTCAIIEDATLRCWGENTLGQLGNGTLTNPGEVVRVALTDVTAVSTASRAGTCAVSGGKIYCWGGRNDDRLGFGFQGNVKPEDYNKAQPGLSIKDVTTAVQVGLAEQFGCALLDGGAVRCWGFGLEGLSNKTTNITDAIALEAGTTSQCALTASGGVKCWSADAYSFGVAQLPETPKYAVTEVLSPSVGKIKQISMNRLQVRPGGNDGAFLCAVFEDGTVGCMGDNVFGQLGVPLSSECSRSGGTSRCPFTKIPNLTGVTQVAAGGATTCVLHDDNSVRCWGYDKEENLGGSSLETTIVW